MKRKISEVSIANSRPRREKAQLPIAPHVGNLQELINLGETSRLYSNINMFSLWKIMASLRELNSLVGMESIKETLFSQILYFLQGFHTRNTDFLHTTIYGPPGCGKTTVAKIIGQIYKGLGILSKHSEFRIATRDDFVGKFLGHTSVKTRKFLESCIGDCLFIDEVYSLAPRNSDRDSFAKEAIDTINQFLSENKENFCCIIAGYEQDVKECFFSMNKGLERRFPWVHRIQEYSSLELAKIFLRMLSSQGWFFSEDEKTVEHIIKTNKEFFKFSGGSIETFITKCKLAHSSRVFSLHPDHRYVITKEDMDNAIKVLHTSQGKPEKLPDMYM